MDDVMSSRLISAVLIAAACVSASRVLAQSATSGADCGLLAGAYRDVGEGDGPAP